MAELSDARVKRSRSVSTNRETVADAEGIDRLIFQLVSFRNVIIAPGQDGNARQ